MSCERKDSLQRTEEKRSIRNYLQLRIAFFDQVPSEGEISQRAFVERMPLSRLVRPAVSFHDGLQERNRRKVKVAMQIVG